jgi:HAD superfamily hydrolase (TIGR01493 family)
MDGYRAVLFDWRGTLAHCPEDAWWVGRALQAIGRPVDPEVVEAAVAGLRAAAELPEVVAAERYEDCSAALHHSVTMRRLERAGLDDELAEALYRLEFDPTSHPLFPDVPEVLAAIRARGVRIALVSDIHFDLRADLAAHRIAELVDVYVLSFEHGFQKPDPRMFTLALDAVGAEPGEALMVGDRASHDGGAVAAGIATLLLPTPNELAPRGLAVVLRLLQ